MTGLVREVASMDHAASQLKILELGSWAGGSAITWATALQAYARPGSKLVCVDPWQPYHDLQTDVGWIYSLMNRGLKRGKIFELFLHNVESAGVGDDVLIMKGKSVDIIPSLRENQFDIVFVDGAHDYESVSRDLALCGPLVKEGGLLCGDDLELQLTQVDEQFARENAHRDFVQDPRTGDLFHPGVAVAVHDHFGDRIGVRLGFWATQKQGQQWMKVDLDPMGKDLHVPKHLRA
jgi:predicted O-methyltransferase YrrM